MKKKRSIILLMLAVSLFISCADEDKEKEPITDPVIEPITFTKEGELSLYKAAGAFMHSIDIEVADDNYERETGLMHRQHMEENQGMLFLYEDAQIRNFHMQNTHIPLDILFFGSDSTAVSFQENALPMDETILPSEVPAQFVLEINAGLVKEWDIEVGDRIDFELE